MTEWKKKEKVIANALDSLTTLQNSIRGENIASNDKIVKLIEAFVSRLKEVQDEARTPDDMNLFSLPIPLIERLDQFEGNNPELFQFDLLEDSLKNAQNLAKKYQFLEVSLHDSLPLC